MTARPRIGIVGAGRTRQGLGPFLARFFERAGARVVGISGRDPARTSDVAVAMSKQLRHAVATAGDAEALARTVDALVVACPVAGHLDGLEAALAAGVPCLCEKPLVPPAEAARGLDLVGRFRDRGLLLAENCQWPFVLAALADATQRPFARPQRLAMGLSPAGTGGAMVTDSLSHVLSMAQALGRFGDGARVVDVTQSDAASDAATNVLRFRIVDGSDDMRVELHLKCCPQPPRPAWFAIDGARFDRELGPDYAISFRRDGGDAVNVQDPLGALVYGFLANLQANQRERTDELAADIQLRIRLYQGVFDALG